MKETIFGKKHIFLALLAIISFSILLYFCFRQWAIVPIVCLFVHTCSLLLLYQDALIAQNPEEWAEEEYDTQETIKAENDPTAENIPAAGKEELADEEAAEEVIDDDICGVPLKSITEEVKASLFFSPPQETEASDETEVSQEEKTEPDDEIASVCENTMAPPSSKPSAAQLLPAKQHIIEMDLISAAQEAMDSLSFFAESQKIKLHLSTTCEKLLMYADPDSIRILFRNIIDNSIKYMGRPGHMIITISLLGDDIFLILKDTGKGLSEDETLHVFELNFQGSNRVSGNGLGLTQTKMIVEAFGGTIYAKSSINNGMAIYIQLPVSGTPKSE